MAEKELKKSVSEKDDFLISHNSILFKKYQIIKKLCSGAFGSIYLGVNLLNYSYVAIKVEPRNIPYQHLESEAYFIYSLKAKGIPEILSFGKTKYYNILVEPFLGKSLYHLYQENNQHFEIKDICLMGIQIIDRLEWIHSKNIIHRDIKPDNFLIGDKDPNVLYLIDFGLSTKYRSSTSGKHIKSGYTGKLTGTAKYSSANTIKGGEQSRKDDLESFAYMIIYFMKGYLPWQDIESKDEINKYCKIYLMKKNITEKKLCEGLPEEIYYLLKYIKNLGFEEKPDYDYLRNLFKKLLHKNKYIYNDKLAFSWVKEGNLKIKNTSFDANKRKSNFHTRLLKCIEKRLEMKNNSNKNNKIHAFNTNSNEKNNNHIKYINNHNTNYNSRYCKTRKDKNLFININDINHKKNLDINLTNCNYSVNNYKAINKKIEQKIGNIRNKKININYPSSLNGNNNNKFFTEGNIKESQKIKNNDILLNEKFKKLKNKIHYNRIFDSSFENKDKMQYIKINKNYNNNDQNKKLLIRKFNSVQKLKNEKYKEKLIKKRPKTNLNSISKLNSKDINDKLRIKKSTNIKYITKIENNNFNYYSLLPLRTQNNKSNIKIKNIQNNDNNSQQNINFNRDYYLKSKNILI